MVNGIIQVDEAYFGGRRKYWKGQRLIGDVHRVETDPDELLVQLKSDTENQDG